MKLFTILLILGISIPLSASTSIFDSTSDLIPSVSTMTIDTPESQTLVTKFETRRLKEGIEITWEADEQDKVEYFLEDRGSAPYNSDNRYILLIK